MNHDNKFLVSVEELFTTGYPNGFGFNNPSGISGYDKMLILLHRRESKIDSIKIINLLKLLNRKYDNKNNSEYIKFLIVKHMGGDSPINTTEFFISLTVNHIWWI